VGGALFYFLLKECAVRLKLAFLILIALAFLVAYPTGRHPRLPQAAFSSVPRVWLTFLHYTGCQVHDLIHFTPQLSYPPQIWAIPK
jgi:hypothetical protein